MVRNITEISRDNRPIRQKSSEVRKRALYRKVRYLYAHLLPTQVACLYLFTLGLFRKKYRALIYDIWMMVCPQVFTKRYVPSVAITSLVSNAVAFRLYEQTEDVGNISPGGTVYSGRAPSDEPTGCLL